MSRVCTDVKSNCCQSEVKTERRSATVGNSSKDPEESRSFQDTRGKKRISRSVSDYIQTTKNLHIRQETLLKSQGEWVSTPEGPDQCHNPLRYTSSFSLRLPFRRKNNNRPNIRAATKLNNNNLQTKSDAGTKVVDVQRSQFGKKDFLIDALRETSSEATKEENASKTKTDNAGYSWGGHGEHDTSSHRPPDGIRQRLVLRDRGQPAKNGTRGPPAIGESVTDPRVTKEETVQGHSGVNDPPGKNAEKNLFHSNLIPFREDTRSTANSDCQICACSSEAINQTLSLPSFSGFHCCDNLKSDPISSTAAMFTSTLFSVLAPHWNGRLRRHKRGFGIGETDGDPNTNLSTDSQNEQQQRLPLQQIQAQGDPVNDFSNRFRRSAGTRRSTVEWQSESFSHVSESKKRLLKTSSLRTNRHTVNQSTEFGVSPMYASVDFGEEPRANSNWPMSLQRSDYRRTSRLAERGESFSSLRSRPTTSTLLLSSRRLNSRKPSSESLQMQKQLSASISSLHIPSKSILGQSQRQPNLASSDLAKETTVGKSFYASTEQLSNIAKPKPTSEWEGMDLSRNQRYVITGDFDRINRNPPATNDTTRERSFSKHLTRLSLSESPRSVQGHEPNDRSISDNNNSQDSNNIERSTWLSPNENANSRFVFPHISSDRSPGSILKRQINKTITRTNVGPSTTVPSNSINNRVESSKTSTMNTTASSEIIHPIANGLSVSFSSASSTPADQNVQSTSGSSKPSSIPVNSVRMRTFTENLSFSPRKNSSVEGTSPSHLWSIYLKRLEESSQSPLDQQSPSTSSEFKPRRVCTPSIYKYLRETSPPKSTQEPPALSSPPFRTVSSKQIQGDDNQSLRFTFDLNSVESRLSVLKNDFISTGAPQSLPPDTGNGSMLRISKSPYSTLISTRAAANSRSSSPVTHQHSRSFSYSSTPVDTMSPKFVKRSYTSVLRDRLSQKTSSVGESAGSADIQLRENETHSNFRDGTTKIMPDAKFPDCQTNTLSLDTTHPKRTDPVIKTISHEALNGIFVPLVDRSNTYTPDSRNSKERSLPLGLSIVGEVVQKEELTEISKGSFQATQGLNSKWSFFSLRSKKDNAKSPPSAEKEGLADKKGRITGLKTSSKMLNRLKLTFGGAFLEDSDTTSKRKTKKEEVSNGRTYESIQNIKEGDELPAKRQIKAEEVLENKASERTRKLDHMDHLTFGTRTKPENISDNNGSEIIIKIYQMDELTVKPQYKPKNLLDLKVQESSQKLDHTDGLTVRRHPEPERVLDVKDPQRSQKLDQTDAVASRTQTKPEKILGIKGLQRGEKLDQTDAGAIRTLSKPERILGIRGLQRSQKLDQTDAVEVSTPTKHGKDSDISVPEKSPNSQTEDQNAMSLNIMPHDPPKNEEQGLFAKSFTFLNSQMIESCNFSSPTLGYRHGKQENLLDMETHKKIMEESRNRLLGRPISPNWPQPSNINCNATLLSGKRSRLGPSLTVCPVDLELQSDNVFFSNFITKSDSTFPSEAENVAEPDNTGNTESSTGAVLLSPSADLMYGLQRKRSVSVSSVVSGRPSGPGRISTGSRQGSNNDLSSLDSLVTRSRHSSSNSPAGSPENVISSIGHISNKGPTGRSDSRGRSPDILELFSWDMETDPTPPHSPPHSLRISQIPSPTSPSHRNSPDTLSPRGLLPLRNYKSTLSAFEESGSETTTDDEYFLNSDDENEKETAL